MGTIRLDPQQVDAATEAYVNEAIGSERIVREAAEGYLQTEIDAIAGASDVADVVATKADLDSYDTSTLTANAIIKVLADETREGASTYYRWVNQSFTYVGKVGPYYTKSETNTAIDGKIDSAIYNDSSVHNQIRLGNGATATSGGGSYAIAIGQTASADSGSIAIGQGSLANYNSVAIAGQSASAGNVTVKGNVTGGSYNVNLGGSISNANYAVAVGRSARVGMDNLYSVALGSCADVSERYEVSVGSSSRTGYGEEGSHTRKITHVTDPTNDQDAATKHYVDTHSGGTVIHFDGAKFYADSAMTDVLTGEDIYDLCCTGAVVLDDETEAGYGWTPQSLILSATDTGTGVFFYTQNYIWIKKYTYSDKTSDTPSLIETITLATAP